LWRDDATLIDILKACQLALDFAANMNRVTFLVDLKTQAAVVHELLVLGEAVKLEHGIHDARSGRSLEGDRRNER
jgi:uncharacterized protein with HEPN domain